MEITIDEPDESVVSGEAASFVKRYYGRSQEISLLRSLLQGKANDTDPASPKPKKSDKSQVVLVSGDAGIGKTRLISQSFNASDEQSRAIVVAGKFDQLVRNQPHLAIVAALDNLVQQLLCRPPAQVLQFRKSALTRLEERASVLCELAPSMTLLLGVQPKSIALSPVQTTVRLQSAFVDLWTVIGEQFDRIVLFIDDLQWIDSASLDLLSGTVVQLASRLLLVGAYRQDEVERGNKLLHFISDLESNQISVNRIELSALTQSEVRQWLGDKLIGSDGTESPDLVRLLLKKTRGNPFYIHQFIAEAMRRQLLERKTGQWTWKIAELDLLESTDNVVTYLVARLNRLPPTCMRVISRAAAIGNRVPLHRLEVVTGESEQELQSILVPAIQEELLHLQSENGTRRIYLTFEHDRIQKAAYDLIQDAERPIFHLTLARLMIDEPAPDLQNTLAFEIAHHLTRGAKVLSISEIPEWINWSLRAASQAKDASACTSSLQYLKNCYSGFQQLISSGANEFNISPNQLNSIAFQYWVLTCEANYGIGDLQEATESLRKARRYAVNDSESASLNVREILVLTALGEFLAAREIGLQTLELLNFRLPLETDASTIQSLWTQLEIEIGDRPITDLVDFPIATNSTDLLIAEVLMRLGPPSFAGEPDWFPVVCLSSVIHALRSGHCSHSASGYMMVAILLGAEEGRSNKMADEFGKLGVLLAKEAGDPSNISMCFAIYGSLVSHWSHSLAIGIEFAQSGYEIGQGSGELLWGSYSLQLKAYLDVASAESLPLLQRRLDSYRERAQGWGNVGTRNMIIAIQLTIQNLLDLTNSPTEYEYLGYNEDFIQPDVDGTPSYLFMFESLRLQIRFLYGEYDLALRSFEISTATEKWCRGTVQSAENRYFRAMSELAQLSSCSAISDGEVDRSSKKTLRYFAALSSGCSENYEHMFLLLSAAFAAFKNQSCEKVILLYKRGIDAASAQRRCKYVAIGHEHLGRYLELQGDAKNAEQHFNLAISYYQKWGARRKADMLQRQCQEIAYPDSEGKELLKALVYLCDADRAIVLFQSGHEIAVSDSYFRAQDLSSMLFDSNNIAAYLPISVVNYVLNIGQSVALDMGSREHAFTSDKYLLAVDGRNILCVPKVENGAVKAALYLDSQVSKTMIELYQRGELDKVISKILS